MTEWKEGEGKKEACSVGFFSFTMQEKEESIDADDRKVMPVLMQMIVAFCFDALRRMFSSRRFEQVMDDRYLHICSLSNGEKNKVEPR